MLPHERKEEVMKRLMMIGLLALLTLEVATPALAARVRVVKRERGHRTTVVVHRGFPIRRALPVVVVRPARRPVLVAPAVFLAPVAWTATVVALPPRERLVWEDGETLYKEEGWTEFVLNADARGEALFLEVGGKVRVEFAEVVFENGEVRVVDMGARTRGPGVYGLLDFRDGRRVDHVRMVARAKSDEARVVLRMAR